MVDVADVTAACVMAAATGELTGAPGLVLLGGPASDASAGLEHARLERSPVVCVGPPAGDALAGIVKATFGATAVSAARAVEWALARPRGPVYLAPGATDVPSSSVLSRAEDPDRAAAEIRAAERPIVIAGIAARDASARSWVRAFAESLPAPVLTTWKAKGTLADPHPLAFGVAGASVTATELVGRADLLIGLGVDDDERETLSLPPRVVWLGADVGGILADLAPRLAGVRADWDVAELDRVKRRLDVRPGGRRARLVTLAREATPAGTVAAFDASLLGAAAGWDCVTPDELLVPARSSLVPFALPAAVAAALASPAAAVLCFADAASAPTADAAIAVACARGLPIGVIGAGELDGRLPRLSAATEPAFAVAVGRWLAERRTVRFDVGTDSDRSV